MALFSSVDSLFSHSSPASLMSMLGDFPFLFPIMRVHSPGKFRRFLTPSSVSLAALVPHFSPFSFLRQQIFVDGDLSLLAALKIIIFPASSFLPLSRTGNRFGIHGGKADVRFPTTVG